MPKSIQTRKQRSRRGGSAPVDYFNAGPAELNLGQGRQFSNMTRSYHGGGLVGGPYPTALGDTLPQNLIASARLEPLQKAFDEIKGMQDGGKRRNGRKASRTLKGRKSRNARKNRGSRKASRKNRKSRNNRKTNRKNRKTSRKNRKTNRKNRKTNRKNRKTNRKNRGSRKNRKGGAHLGYQNVNAPGMLLTNAQYAKAGLSPEWNLAKDPNAFAPLVARS